MSSVPSGQPPLPSLPPCFSYYLLPHCVLCPYTCSFVTGVFVCVCRVLYPLLYLLEPPPRAEGLRGQSKLSRRCTCSQNPSCPFSGRVLQGQDLCQNPRLPTLHLVFSSNTTTILRHGLEFSAGNMEEIQNVSGFWPL